MKNITGKPQVSQMLNNNDHKHRREDTHLYTLNAFYLGAFPVPSMYNPVIVPLFLLLFDKFSVAPSEKKLLSQHVVSNENLHKSEMVHHNNSKTRHSAKSYFHISAAWRWALLPPQPSVPAGWNRSFPGNYSSKKCVTLWIKRVIFLPLSKPANVIKSLQNGHCSRCGDEIGYRSQGFPGDFTERL